MLGEDGEAIVGISAQVRPGTRKHRSLPEILGHEGVGLLCRDFRSRIAREIQNRHTTQEPSSYRIPQLLTRSNGGRRDRLLDLLHPRFLPGKGSGLAGTVDQSITSIVHKSSLDGGGIGGIASHNCAFVNGQGVHQVSEFAFRADEDDNGMVVGEKGGKDARAEVSRRAEEENSHD